MFLVCKLVSASGFKLHCNYGSSFLLIIRFFVRAVEVLILLIFFNVFMHCVNFLMRALTR